jgi:integrase
MRPALVQGFLDGFRNKQAAKQKARAVLKQVENFAIVRELLPIPITIGTKAPGSKGGHTPWTDEQVEYAQSAVSPYLAKAITLGANTGQRGSDLIRMCWNHIVDKRGRLGIKVTQLKTGLKIWVPFTRTLMTTMASWERSPGPILRKPDGLPFSNRAQLTDRWARERAHHPPLAGLVMHGLRATACVRLKRAGAEVPEISSMVGMSEVMVARYTRFSEQEENALAAVFRLDGEPYVPTRFTAIASED